MSGLLASRATHALRVLRPRRPWRCRACACGLGRDPLQSTPSTRSLAVARFAGPRRSPSRDRRVTTNANASANVNVDVDVDVNVNVNADADVNMNGRTARLS